MSLFVLIKGLGLGASMIIPIGAQNAFVLNQGINKNHHIMSATICSLCDIILIAAGVFGSGMLFSSTPQLLFAITLAGGCFLLYYGIGALRSAWNIHRSDAIATTPIKQSRTKVAICVLSVTLLNPHVYLDTVVVLGSIGSQYDQEQRSYFAVGAMLASILWFYGLSLCAAKLSHILSQAKVKVGIDVGVAIIMFIIAVQLFSRLF